MQTWRQRKNKARVCSRVKQIGHNEHVQIGYILGVGATPLSLGMASAKGDQHYGMRISDRRGFVNVGTRSRENTETIS